MSVPPTMPHPRTVFGFACLAAHLGLVASAAAYGPLYLRGSRMLSIAAPISTVPRDDVSAAIGSGDRAVLAEFRSPQVTERVDAATATAVLYLVTGKLGMDDCAVVTAELSRRSTLDERTVVGTGSLPTSIRPRRQTTSPIVVTFPLSGPVALPTDQIALSIGIENRCSEARAPALRYDALGWVSALRLDGVPVETTTTTTSTTSTTGIPTEPTTTTTSTTTTTTLPYPFGCLFQPLEGYEAVFCRLDTVAEVLFEEGPGSFGGTARFDRVQRRLEQARGRVILAQTGRRRPRQLRRAVEQLAVMGRLVRRGVRQGLVDSDLGEELTSLLGAASAQIGYLPRR